MWWGSYMIVWKVQQRFLHDGVKVKAIRASGCYVG